MTDIYAGLDQEDVRVVKRAAKTLRSLNEGVACGLWDAGKLLLEVQSRLREEGRFCAWLAVEFEWSQSYAYDLIGVAKRYTRDEVKLYASSAIRLLGRSSTPQSARDEARGCTEAGEFVTDTRAKEIVYSHKEKPDTPVLTTIAAHTAGTTEEDKVALSPEQTRSLQQDARREGRRQKMDRIASLTLRAKKLAEGEPDITEDVLVLADEFINGCRRCLAA